MEFATRDQIAGVAELLEAGRGLQTRAERLARWAEVLKRDPDRTLRSLGEIEFVPEGEREALRIDGSPLTVAFEDSLLRVAGLQSDKYGDAIRFFGLSEREGHRLLCSCMNGWSMRAGAVGSRVERLAARKPGRILARWLGIWSSAAAATALWMLH
jgi:hypothetical protein